MQFYIFMLILMSLSELALFFLVWRFFIRLRRSEQFLTQLQAGQDKLLGKLQLNAVLEKELMDSFSRRQDELIRLDAELEVKVERLNTLLEQAETISRSPHFLRELILSGSRKGRSSAQLAKSTGLSVDEVELILAQSYL